MDNVIAAINMTHPMLERVPDQDVLERFNEMKKKALHIISSLTLSKNGRYVGDFEGSAIVEIPLNQIEVLKEIKKRILTDCGIRRSSIGVGENVEDALVAMRDAADTNSIKVFKPEMTEDKVEPQSVAVGEQDQPVQKAEISPDAQNMVASLVGKIKQNKDYVESLQESNPQAYESIVEVMQAIAAMVAHIKDTNSKKLHDEEQQRLENVVNSVHDGKFDDSERAILGNILSSMKPKQNISKSEGDVDDLIGRTAQKLHQVIPKLESIRNDNPEVFATYVKMVRLLNVLHKDKGSLNKPVEEEIPHIRPPAKETPITHPRPVYMPGSVRQYSSQSARQKTPEGEWVSVAGGIKRRE